jgi:hypothetical protein
MDTKIYYSAPYCDGRTPLQCRNMSGPPSMTILVTGGAGYIGGQGSPFRRIGDYSRPRTDRIVPVQPTHELLRSPPSWRWPQSSYRVSPARNF